MAGVGVVAGSGEQVGWESTASVRPYRQDLPRSGIADVLEALGQLPVFQGLDPPASRSEHQWCDPRPCSNHPLCSLWLPNSVGNWSTRLDQGRPRAPRFSHPAAQADRSLEQPGSSGTRWPFRQEGASPRSATTEWRSVRAYETGSSDSQTGMVRRLAEERGRVPEGTTSGNRGGRAAGDSAGRRQQRSGGGPSEGFTVTPVTAASATG